MGSITYSARYDFAPTPEYKISKAAMNMLTAQYASEFEEKGFTFLAVSPGVSLLFNNPHIFNRTVKLLTLGGSGSKPTWEVPQEILTSRRLFSRFARLFSMMMRIGHAMGSSSMLGSRDGKKPKDRISTMGRKFLGRQSRVTRVTNGLSEEYKR